MARQKAKPTPLLTLIGSNVRRIRESKRITQEQLADSIGKTAGTVGNIENGKVSTMMLSTLERLANGLGVVPADLCLPLAGEASGSELPPKKPADVSR